MAEIPGSINAAIRKEGLKNGVFLGLCVLALSILSFYITITFITSPLLIICGSVFFAYLIPFILSVFFAFIIKSHIPLLLSFRQLVTGIFIMMITSYFILSIGKDL